MFLNYPKTLLQLFSYLKKFPGVGNTTAMRFAFSLLKWQDTDLQSLGTLISTLKKTIQNCPICGCISNITNCSFCDKEKRNCDMICIISSPKDAFAIDSTKTYNGLYHVIDHLLSPMQGYDIESLKLPQLGKRISELNIKEVIIALDSSLEGDATTLFLKSKLNNVKITRLAFGLPVGSSLEYVNSSTLAKALSGRQHLS